MRKALFLIMMGITVCASHYTKVLGNEQRHILDIIESFETTYSEINGYTSISEVNLLDFGENQYGTLYIIEKNNSQVGYIVYSDNMGFIQMSITSTQMFESHKDSLYYLFPSRYYTKSDRDNLVNEVSVLESSVRYFKGQGLYYTNLSRDWRDYVTGYTENIVTFDFNSGIPLLSGNTITFAAGYHSEKVITNVPDYLNYDEISCVPTSTAMMMAYYDNEFADSLTSFDNGDYPLTGEPKKHTNSAETNLVEFFRSYMSTDKSGTYKDGNSMQEWSFEISRYLDEKTLYGYYEGWISSVSDFTTQTPNEYANYKKLIDKGNPSILFLFKTTGSPYNSDHAVIGIGYFSNRTLGNGMIVYDNITHGKTLIKDDYVDNFGFLYND